MSSMASNDSDSKNPSIYSRKEKSLGILCTNFLKLYNRDGVESVGLDNAAAQLGVERRRIYDIVNILESVGILARKAKNQYSWKGFSAIPLALHELMKEALKENSNDSNCCNMSNVSNENECRRPSGSNNNRKEKSLGLLARNFIKLFLTSKAELISLDKAATVLLGDLHDPTAMRTKVRRLYDIANVFASMDLIEKVRHPENGKPAFKWLGVEGKSKSKSNKTLDLIEGSRRRAFGTDITNINTKRHKEGSLFDCNLKGKATVATHLKNDMFKDEYDENLMQQHLQRNSKDFVFGPFSPASLPRAGASANKKVSRVHDWENLASTYRPQYENQVLTDLFARYMEAYKLWHVEVGEKKQIQPVS